MPKYFVKLPLQDEKEVSKEEFIQVEQLAGFHNGKTKEPATWTFGGYTYISGRQEMLTGERIDG